MSRSIIQAWSIIATESRLAIRATTRALRADEHGRRRWVDAWDEAARQHMIRANSARFFIELATASEEGR